MEEVFELIKERLEKEKSGLTTWAEDEAFKLGIEKAQKIVSEVEAEYGNGWIPCDSGRMPVLGQKVLACINPSIAEHEIILARYEDYKWWHDGTVIAWRELPEPYKPTTD